MGSKVRCRSRVDLVIEMEAACHGIPRWLALASIIQLFENRCWSEYLHFSTTVMEALGAQLQTLTHIMELISQGGPPVPSMQGRRLKELPRTL